jgi:SOS response regulatory protein OraA/RecX
VPEQERREALERLVRAGYVDDARFAGHRAAELAARGLGDDAIRADLEHRGLAGVDIASALEGLAPEAERARRILERSGSDGRALRRLAQKGFAAETLELVAPEGSAELG